MSRAASVSRAGSVYRDDCSARYYMRRASPPAAKFRTELSCEKEAIVTFRGLALHRKKTSETLFECTRKNDE